MTRACAGVLGVLLLLSGCGGKGIALRPVSPDDRIERFQTTAEGGVVPGDSDIVGQAFTSEAAEVPVLSKAPPAPPALRRQAHKVRAGETLSSIARLYGVSGRGIVSLNALSNPNRIYVGMFLAVPVGGQGGASFNSPGRHVVKRGDTLYALADQYRTTISALKSVNRIRNVKALSLGQVLIVPSSKQYAAATPSAKATIEAAKDRAELKNTETGKKDLGAKQKIVRLSPAPEREKKTFLRPVKGKINSRFGEKKFGQRNNGIDISGKEGSAVKAAENGVVVYSGSAVDGFGNLILLRHADGYLTAYGYNRKNLVARGDRVRRGQAIAELGKSGDIDKATLHFELRRKSRPIDPQKNFTR